MSVRDGVTFEKGGDSGWQDAIVFDDDPVQGWDVEQRLSESRQIWNLFRPSISRCHQIDDG